MAQRNEGEGNRTAAREHGRHATAHAKTGRARKHAHKTLRAMETPEGTAMREAEIKGKSAARGEDPQLYKKGVRGVDPKPDPDVH
jgi:hypothetical protein